MNMIILTEEQNSELTAINEQNIHLSRAVRPISLQDGSFAIGSDLLDDKETWENWVDFLSDLPQREVSTDEFIAHGFFG